MSKKIIIPVSLALCLLMAALPIMVSAEQTTFWDMIMKSLFPQPTHIKILNPVSKPTLWGKWETEFQTTGTGDVEIQAYTATFFQKDIEYVQLYCGGKEIDVEEHFSGKGVNDTFFEQIDNGKIIAKNWNCDGKKAKLILRILATGHHYLSFSFLGETAYAENFADCTATIPPCNCCDVNNMWVKITAPSGGGSIEYNLTYQSSSGTCGTTPYVNETWNRSIGYTFCTTEGTYTAIENASAAGGTETCASYSNDTSTSFDLYTVTWDTDANWCDCKMGATGCNGGACDGSTRGFTFDTGTTSDCCGDDSGEYYRYCNYVAPASGFPDTGDCVATDDMCCNPSTDCVNAAGTACVANDTGNTDGDGDGNVDYCLNNQWYDCYNGNNSQCAGGYTCTSNDCVGGSSIINGGHGTTCNAASKCFLIMNSTGTVKARFDVSGNVDVKGSWSANQTSLSPPAGSWIVRNSTAYVLYIGNTGNLATRGYFYQQTNPSPSGSNNFILKDSSGTVVGYISGTAGVMYFKGVLHYNSDF